METDSLAWGQMAMGLFGGLAVFLFGLDQLTTSLKAVAGARMRDVLAGATTNRFKGVLAGAFTTAVIQSSSVTTVLAVGFVSAGLVSMPQAIGVIMGAEIGTTITAQIIAFKVTKYALAAVAIGFVLQAFFNGETIQRYGMIILGLGLVFLGMTMMGDATRPLRAYQPFIELLQQMDEPAIAILISAGFTALIQSSSATTGIIIMLAAQGLISLEQGIALVFGANIGTCVTALLAAIGKERPAVRTALIHVMFNVLGVVLWFGFIDEIAQVIRLISPAATELTGTARLAADTPRQIANAHTLFNVGNTLIFISFAGAFAWLVTKLVPDKPRPAVEGATALYLDPNLLEAPMLALQAVRLELVRLGQLVLPMIQAAPRAVVAGSQVDLRRLGRMDEGVDSLHSAIIGYLGQISRGDLSPTERELLYDYIGVANYFESMGDLVDVDLGHAGERRLQLGVRISPATQQALQRLGDKVVWSLETAIAALDRRDNELALQIIEAKAEINELADDAAQQVTKRLVAEEPRRTETFQIESELIEQLKRIYYFTKRVAKLLVERDKLKEQPAPAQEGVAA